MLVEMPEEEGFWEEEEETWSSLRERILSRAWPISTKLVRVPESRVLPAGVANQGQPGMLAQMAATACSVAVGSTIGHGISHMLFVGRSEAAAPEPAVAQSQAVPAQFQQGISCDVQSRGIVYVLL